MENNWKKLLSKYRWVKKKKKKKKIKKKNKAKKKTTATATKKTSAKMQANIDDMVTYMACSLGLSREPKDKSSIF